MKVVCTTQMFDRFLEERENAILSGKPLNGMRWEGGVLLMIDGCIMWFPVHFVHTIHVNCVFCVCVCVCVCVCERERGGGEGILTRLREATCTTRILHSLRYISALVCGRMHESAGLGVVCVIWS